MQKQAPSLGRLLVMAGFALSCFGLLLFLWLAFGGTIPLQPKGYRFKADFPQATSLAKEADVRISGVPVGKVVELGLGPGNTTEATIQIDRKYAPIHTDVRAILRQKTLLGETYLELTPGTASAPTLPEGGTLRAINIAPTVQLDQIFRAFDQRTRDAFQVWMQSQAQAVKGRGADISDAIGNLAPFAEDTTKLLAILNSQQGAVRQLVSNTGVVFNALTARDDQLRALIQNSNSVFQTLANRNQELADTFRVLPTFEAETTTTVNRLARFTKATNPLITQLRPAARQLSPTLKQLALLAPDLKALFIQLNPLIKASKAGLPALTQVLDDLDPLFGQLDPALRQINPILRGLAPYQREISAFFSNTVAATGATDLPPGARVPIHYLRTTNPLNPEVLAAYPNRIGSNRPNPYVLPGGFDSLASGLRSYETRHCGNGIPTLSNSVLGLLGPLGDVLQKNVFGSLAPGAVAAPPCVQQGKYPSLGGPPRELTQYPHVRADAPGGP